MLDIYIYIYISLSLYITYNKHIYNFYIHVFLYIICLFSNHQAKDKLQWIAVWQLLNHLQHLACYKSRLQLILGFVIVLNNVLIYN